MSEDRLFGFPESIPGQLAMDTDEVRCFGCDGIFQGSETFPKYSNGGAQLCPPCDTAAWARIDASAAMQPATAPFSNAWD